MAMAMNWLACPMLVMFVLGFCCFAGTSTPAAGAEPVVIHDVYFSLTDNSEQAKNKLVADCKKYLTGHPGELFFAAGVLAPDFTRDVNDREFDVSLHVVFKNKAMHDDYQKAEGHLKFIAENNGNWKKVRVFDSYAEPAATTAGNTKRKGGKSAPK
jgi:hypothetical protein